MAAVERNSDGSYDAVDSGGFGKDYHGQDAFGERIGGTGIGGSHFGGFESGHFGVGDGRDHFEREANSYADIAQTEVPDTSAFEGEEEVGSAMRDSLRDLNSETTENSNTGSMDTSFQIGGTEDDAKKSKELEAAVEKAVKDEEAANKAVEEALDLEDKIKQNTARIAEKRKNEYTFSKDASLMENLGKLGKTVIGSYTDTDIKELEKDTESLAKALGIDVGYESGIKTLGDTIGTEKLNKLSKAYESLAKTAAERVAAAKANQQKAQNTTKEAKSNLDKYNSSFTDKMEESKEEAKAGSNMSSVKTSPSDYLTKANKDSTKEVPREAPSRNDFGNHAVNTLKGVVDRVADNTTAKALGLKSVEEFAKENGYDPDKLSTMKAYMQYQNKQIMKAIPGIVKQIGSYVVERVKDVVDPSQLPERIRNTLARYNLASLIGAAILSMNSGAGLQASLDQALTMVDPEDQAAVSDYLEDVLNDEGTVNDLKTAFDDALAPQQNSDTAELDESIVNIGRKDNTDYSGFNAGLGTTSDADVKVFIARNVKADPILRRMISKMGK